MATDAGPHIADMFPELSTREEFDKYITRRLLWRSKTPKRVISPGGFSGVIRLSGTPSKWRYTGSIKVRYRLINLREYFINTQTVTLDADEVFTLDKVFGYTSTTDHITFQHFHHSRKREYIRIKANKKSSIFMGTARIDIIRTKGKDNV